MDAAIASVSVLAGIATLVVAALTVWTTRHRRRLAPVSLVLTGLLVISVMGLLFEAFVPVVNADPIRVERAEDLGPELEDVLDDLRWMFVPRGAVEVNVDESVLEQPIAGVERLTRLALDAGVRVDVSLATDAEASRSAESTVKLVWSVGETTLPPDVRFTESGANDVFVSLGDDSDAECSLDGIPGRSGGSLGEFFDAVKTASPSKFEKGWHRLHCRAGDASATRYVEVTGLGVAVATTEDASVVKNIADESTDPEDHGLYRAAKTESIQEMAAAEMLVLDRWPHSDACDAAKRVLERGGSVVIAMPPREFDCPELVPDRPRYLVDRRPRLTFVPDPTFDHLEHAPSCVLGPKSTCVEALPSELEELAGGRQEAAIEKACKSAFEEMGVSPAPCDSLSWESHERQVATVFPRHGPGGSLDEDALRSAMEVGTAIKELEVARAELEGGNQRTLRDNHVIWIFSADPFLPEARSGIYDSLLEATGARIEMVPVTDPYGASLRHLGRAATPPGVSLPIDRVVKSPAERVSNSMPRCRSSLRCVNELVVSPEVFRAPSEQGVQSELLQTGRFAAEVSTTPLPIRFQSWDANASPKDALPFGRYLQTKEWRGLSPRVLSMGTLVGRGHLLLLSYSPFEFPDGVPLVGEAGKEMWRGARGAAKIDDLGPGQVRALYRNTGTFSGRSGTGVRSVEEPSPGVVRIEVYRSIEDGAEELATLGFEGMEQRGSLVDFDFSRGSFEYAVDVESVLGSATACTRITPSLRLSEALPITICPREESGGETILPGALALESLARYTGGCFGESCESPTQQGQAGSIWTTIVSLAFAGLWGRRFHRRLRAEKATARIKAAESEVQRRYDPPEAVVAAAGDWGARATTWERTGAFGGYRPLEPGDRVSATVLADLVLLSRGEGPLIPRVNQRIQEAAPTTRVVVNLGPSMRRPRRRGVFSKVRLASEVAELVAAEAWRMRATVGVFAVGVEGRQEAVAETTLHPGRGEVERALSELAASPTAKEDELWSQARPEAGAFVYVSDFQLEDLDRLSEWILEAEAAGVRVAGVLVYSKAEFTMIEAGRLAGSRAFVDRADWSSLDVLRQMRFRTEQVEGVFQAASGGLSVVDTTMSTRDLELMLRERRVLEVLH